jgi:hypothetical protein
MRHGEKLYETLASREELRRAQDMGDYWRVRMDGRGLEYAKYFTEGDTGEVEVDDYTSHNTERLDVEGVRRLLLTLPEMRAELALGPAADRGPSPRAARARRNGKAVPASARPTAPARMERVATPDADRPRTAARSAGSRPRARR